MLRKREKLTDVKTADAGGSRYIKQGEPGHVYARYHRDAKHRPRKPLRLSAENRRVDPYPPEAKNTEVFETAANEWYKSAIPVLKESSANKYRNLIDSYIVPTFGSIPLDQLCQETIESGCKKLLLTGWRKAKGPSPKMIADILSVMRNIISFSVKAGKYVPCDVRSIHIRQPAKDMRVLNLAEQDRLCQYLYIFTLILMPEM